MITFLFHAAILFTIVVACGWACWFMLIGDENSLFRDIFAYILLIFYLPGIMFFMITLGAQINEYKYFKETPEANGLYIYLFGVHLIAIFSAFARLFRKYGIIEARSGQRSNSGVDCLYFAIVTWTTVGYGDFVPASRASRMLAAYAAIAGYFMMAAMFAALVTRMTLALHG